MSRSIPVLLLLLLIALPLAAQTPARHSSIGVAGGVSRGWQDGGFGVYPGSTACGEFTSAAVEGYYGALVAILPDLFFERLGATVGLRWSRSTALYLSLPIETFMMFDSETRTVVPIPRENRYTVEGGMATIDLMLRYEIAGSLAVSFGGWAGNRSPLAISQVERSLDDRYNFDGSRDTAMVLGLAPTPRALGFGLQLGATYQIPISNALSIQPELSIRYDPAGDVLESRWQNLSVGMGGSILFAITPDTRPVAVETAGVVETVAPPPPEPKPTPALSASLKLRAVDAAENDLPLATVTIYETHVRRTVPFPSDVEFPRHSADLPERYRRIRPSEASAALIDSLAAGPTSAIENDMLNVLGLRLRQNPAARVTLTGTTAPREAGWLAYARVEAIRSYLESVWRIDPERVEVRAREDQSRRNDPPGVTITGSRAIVGPIELERVDREFEPPRIRITPTWEAAAGIRNWTIRFRHGATGIGDVDGSSRGGSGVTQLNWRILNEPSGESEQPLSAELTVEDSAGAVRRAADTLPLRLDRRARLVSQQIRGNGDQRAVYTLYPQSARERNVELISNLLSKLPRGAKLSVVAVEGKGRSEGEWLMSEARGRLAVANPGVTLGRRIGRLEPSDLDGSTTPETGSLGLAALVIDLPGGNR